jgi:hypothetical protein
MTRRPNARLTDAEIGRLLAHMPDPPPPAADLTDRIVAAAIAANVTRARRAPRRFGRRIWWAIAILGAAGAVTAAAANAGRFELARVLSWPQEVVRAAGWAPRHPRGPVFVRAERPPTPRPAAPALVPPLAAAQRPLAPLAVDRGERVAPIGIARPQQRFAGAERIERPLRAFVRPHAAARFGDENRRAAAPLIARTDRAADHTEFATPATSRPVVAESSPALAAHDNVERAAKDDALRFHDADEYARRQVDRDWRPRDNLARRDLAADAGAERWAADRGDHPWAADRTNRPWAANRDHPWAKPQGWQRRADIRPFHQFKAHPPRGRRG